MATFKYRLQPLLDQKIQRQEEAEKTLAARIRELAAEQRKLKELEQRQRELAVKKQTRRREILVPRSGESVSGGEVQRRSEYLQGLEADLEQARGAVLAQDLTVEESKERLAQARRNLTACSRQVEILKKHRDKLEQRFRREIERKEALELDDVGNTLFLSRRSGHESP